MWEGRGWIWGSCLEVWGIDLRTGIICDELPEISDCQTNKWGCERATQTFKHQQLKSNPRWAEANTEITTKESETNIHNKILYKPTFHPLSFLINLTTKKLPFLINHCYFISLTMICQVSVLGNGVFGFRTKGFSKIAQSR